MPTVAGTSGAGVGWDMATVVPSNSAIDRIVQALQNGDPAAAQRVDQLNDDNHRLLLEDSRTIPADRGPMRGFGGGRARKL